MSGNLILHEPDTPSLLPTISLVSELSLCRNLFCCYSAKGGSKVLSTKKGKKIYPAFLMGAIAPIFLGPCFYLFIHIKTKLYCLGPVKGILLRCTTPQLKGRQCSPDCSATWWCVPSAAHGNVGRSQCCPGSTRMHKVRLGLIQDRALLQEEVTGKSPGWLSVLRQCLAPQFSHWLLLFPVGVHSKK